MKLALAVCALLLAGPAFAQTPPYGSPVWNQSGHMVVVTPSDTATFQATRALYVGSASACTLVVLGYNDQTPATTITFSNVQSGQILPISVVAVKNTSTTCTGIVAFY